jgi:hypothetical protein
VKMMPAILARVSAFRLDAMPLRFLFALRARIILSETVFKKMIQARFVVAKLREKFSDRHAVFIAVIFHALNIRQNLYVCQWDKSVNLRLKLQNLADQFHSFKKKTNSGSKNLKQVKRRHIES